MRHGVHFISGLPRSGSTLLAAIPRRNQRFHAMMTSPAGSIYMAMQTAVSRWNEAAIFIDADHKRELARGAFWIWNHAIGANKVVFDTNRVVHLFSNAKVICRVRHISWIMDSIERVISRNPHELSGLFGFEAGGTVYTRVNRLAMNDDMVGYALDALREAYYGEHRDRLTLVEYGALAQEPERTMNRIYEFIGESPFEHDFNNVKYSTNDFDLAIGAPGSHTVARRVAFTPRATILAPQSFQRFEGDQFWNGAGAIPAVQVIRRPE